MPSFLCLHGFTGTPESWSGLLAFQSQGNHVLRPHILGHDPENSIVSPTFEAEVDRLASLVRKQVAGERVHVVGYSQGGRLAIGLLVRHPELFAAATLIGASPGLESKAERQKRRKADERLARRLEEQGLEPFLEFWQTLPLFATQQAAAEEQRLLARLEAQRTQRLRHRPEGLARALRVLGLGSMPNYWPALSDLEPPVHLMVGKLDGKFRRIAECMAQRLLRATVRVVPSVGHNLLLEAPKDVADQLEGF